MAKTNDENGYADNKAAAELLPPDVQNHFDRLNRSLHALWKLGRNVILVWAPYETGIEVLVLPNYAIAALAEGLDHASRIGPLRGCSL